MPIVWMVPNEVSGFSHFQHYLCAMYKTNKRRILSTTGHSNSFIMDVRLPSNMSAAHWTEQAVALLTTLDDRCRQNRGRSAHNVGGFSLFECRSRQVYIGCCILSNCSLDQVLQALISVAGMLMFNPLLSCLPPSLLLLHKVEDMYAKTSLCNLQKDCMQRLGNSDTELHLR